jgi:hypothetical protein
MNREFFAPLPSGQFLSLIKSTQAMNEFAKQITESPAMKAMIEMADNHRKQMEAITRYARSTRGRKEMSMYRKANKGEKLAAFIAKVLDGIFLLQSMAKLLPRLSKFTNRKCGRALLMALRGLALSCAPNSSRKSDKSFISRAILGIA